MTHNCYNCEMETHNPVFVKDGKITLCEGCATKFREMEREQKLKAIGHVPKESTYKQKGSGFKEQKGATGFQKLFS